jgi:hypothetical protein
LRVNSISKNPIFKKGAPPAFSHNFTCTHTVNIMVNCEDVLFSCVICLPVSDVHKHLQCLPIAYVSVNTQLYSYTKVAYIYAYLKTYIFTVLGVHQQKITDRLFSSRSPSAGSITLLPLDYKVMSTVLISHRHITVAFIAQGRHIFFPNYYLLPYIAELTISPIGINLAIYSD